jgi:hypothetical protein
MGRTLGDPHGRLAGILTGIERRLRAVERAHPTTTSYDGPRADDPAGDGSHWGPRVRIGLLADGTYGVERWTSTGVRQTPTWS